LGRPQIPEQLLQESRRFIEKSLSRMADGKGILFVFLECEECSIHTSEMYVRQMSILFFCPGKGQQTREGPSALPGS
jgi:hypothetical protein